MAETISRVMVILANPASETDQRSNLINNLCKTYSEACQNTGLEVDFLDLYKDEEFDPVHNLDERDTKVLEYQIRLRKAQMIVFFHPVWWQSVPALLKGFLDKVLISGFGYRYSNKVVQGLLEDKQAIVVATSEQPVWQLRYIYGNILENFWQKVVLGYCGVKSKIFVFGNFRSVPDSEIEKWHKKMENLAKKINTKESALDWF